MIDRKIKCDNCGRLFEMTDVQLSRYIKNPTKHNFCSKSCSAKYNKNSNSKCERDSTGRFIKQEKITTVYNCTNCGKLFTLTDAQVKRLQKEQNPNLFCSKSCSAKYSNSHRDDSWKVQKKKTSLLKYENENYVNSDKISKTLKNKYKDNDYGFKNKTYKRTMIEKYGTDNIGKSDWMKQHNLKKYGTEYYFQSEDYQNQMEDKFNSRDDYYARVSKANKFILDLLKSHNMCCGVEKYIKPYYYDIEVNNILIEIDPTVTHNSIMNIFGNDPIEPMYHYNKSRVALDAGYKCIHIFDWDSTDKLINNLLPRQIVYARNLKLKEVALNDVDNFLNEYHYQNTCKGQDIRLGLYEDEELIQVMTFGKPRYNKNYEWELLRLCTKPKYNVVGGAEKLFKHFLNVTKPVSIISYCDLSKFTGEVYARLGFKLLIINKPTKHWYNMKTKRHITDNLLRQRGFSQLHNDKNYQLYSKGQSNETLMLDNDYLPIYDCGQATYIYNRDDK